MPPELNQPAEETGEVQPDSSTSFDAIAGALSDAMPEVSDHAIAEAEEQARKKDASVPAGLTYKDGTPFDPEIHEISPGTGKVIKRRKGGTKRASVSTVGAGKAANLPPAPDSAEIQGRATGKMYANCLIALATGIGGDEFKPDNSRGYDEREYLEGAFADYCIATGKTDLPPGVVLCVAIGSYIVPRFNQPKTQTKLQRLKDWVGSKILARRAKKAAKAEQVQAQRESDKNASEKK